MSNQMMHSNRLLMPILVIANNEPHQFLLSRLGLEVVYQFMGADNLDGLSTCTKRIRLLVFEN
jgi:hypothetical protein